MKKNLFLLAAFFISLTSFAQDYKFVLSPDGIVTTNPEDPNYLVYDYPNFTQKELYEKVLMAIGEIFTSPKDVLSTVQDKQISILCNIKNGVQRTKFHPFDVKFKLVFEFKDNKIKVNAPVVERITTMTVAHKFQEMFIRKSVLPLGGTEFTIYNMKGKLKNEKAKETLEYTVNATVFTILAKVVDKAVNNDW